MIGRRERLLAEFVNREIEYERFCAMLDELDRPVFAVWADGGLGKTWLINRFIAECEERGLHTILVDEHRHGNYLSVLRTMRDAIGAARFARFTDLVNFYTVKNYNLNVNLQNTNISVAPGSISEATIDTMAGVVIKDLNLTEARTDMDVPDSERMIRLTEQFVADLQTVDKPIVVFFDAVEKMPEVTSAWLHETLLTYIPDTLKHVRIVLAGRKQPQFDRDTRLLIQEFQLKPLSVEHIMAYLERRGLRKEDRTELAYMLHAVSDGKPNVVAMHTDTYLELRQARGA